MWRSMVMFKKELHNGIPNSNVWRVLWKHLHLKVYKLSIIQHSNIWNTIVKLFIKHPV
jgi:hypothetical protein